MKDALDNFADLKANKINFTKPYKAKIVEHFNQVLTAIEEQKKQLEGSAKERAERTNKKIDSSKTNQPSDSFY